MDPTSASNPADPSVAFDADVKLPSDPRFTDLGEGPDDQDFKFNDSFDQSSLVKQKESELKEMQDQIESYNQLINQLTSQREIAAKKLIDMDCQINELTKVLESERLIVEGKDNEVKTKRSQLEYLKKDGDQLDKLSADKKAELDRTDEKIRIMDLQDKQIKDRLIELKEFLKQTNDAVEGIEKAMKLKDTIQLSALCNQKLTLPSQMDINKLLIGGPNSHTDNSNAAFDLTNTELDNSANFDPFAGNDPFDGDDPFKSVETNLNLPEDDPFNPTGPTNGFSLPPDDPFAPPITRHDGF